MIRPGSEYIDLRVRRDDAAVVLDAVAGAEPSLHCHVAQTGVHRQVNTVVGIVDATKVVPESPEVVELSELPGLIS